MNWDDPAERLELLEREGAQVYNRLLTQHLVESVVSRVGGHAIRPVNTRFGGLFAVDSTGMAYATLEEAQRFARDQPAHE